MNPISRGVRNAFRGATRTISVVVILGLSLGLALTMLVARQAVSQKIANVQSSIGNTITVSPAGFSGFSGNGNPLTSAQMKKVSQIMHVTNVSESLTDRLDSSDTSLKSATNLGSLGQRFARENAGGFQNFGSSGDGDTSQNSNPDFANFTPPVQVIGTDNPTEISQSQGGGAVKITSGTAFNSGTSANVAIVGSALASKNNLKVGSTFTAYSQIIKVVAIYSAGNTFANGLLIMPLATVQNLSDQSDDITSATVTVDSINNVAGVTSAIKTQLGSAADVESAQDASQSTISSLKNVKSISTISLIGAIIAGAIIVLLTMVMIVRERKHEIGILKAIGASNRKVIAQFMSEAVTFTLVAAVLGIIIGALAGSPITNMLVSSNSDSNTSQQASSNTIGTSSFRSHFGGNFGGGSRNSNFSSGFRRPTGGTFNRGAGSVKNSIKNISVSVGWDIVAYGFGAAIVIAIIGSALTGGLIAKVRPSEVLRSE